MELHDRVKAVRQYSGLTQKEFAGRLCVSASYVSKMESGKEKATNMLIKLIALEFGVSLQWINHEEGEMLYAKAKYDRWSRDSAQDFGKGAEMFLIELSEHIKKHPNAVIDQNVGGIAFEVKRLLSLYDKNEHFGSLILEQLASIIISFCSYIIGFEELDQKSPIYSAKIIDSLWNLCNEINYLIKEVATAYEERQK